MVRDDRALRDFGIPPRGIREVLARALVNEDLGFAPTAGRTRFRPDTSAAVGADTASAAAGWTRARHGSPVPRSRRTARFPEIGGHVGWYYGDLLWRLRGLLDLAMGGPGLRRGRREADTLTPGDTVDF